MNKLWVLSIVAVIVLGCDANEEGEVSTVDSSIIGAPPLSDTNIIRVAPVDHNSGDTSIVNIDVLPAPVAPRDTVRQ